MSNGYTFGTCSAPNPLSGGIVDTYEEGSSCSLKTLEDCNGDIVSVKASGKRKVYRWSIIGTTAGDLEAGQEYGDGGIITSVTTRYRRGDYSVVDITVEAPVTTGGGGS